MSINLNKVYVDDVHIIGSKDYVLVIKYNSYKDGTVTVNLCCNDSCLNNEFEAEPNRDSVDQIMKYVKLYFKHNDVVIRDSSAELISKKIHFLLKKATYFKDLDYKKIKNYADEEAQIVLSVRVKKRQPRGEENAS